MKYKIVSSVYWYDLEVAVNKAIEDGWTLQGGVSVTWQFKGNIFYTQAMIKEVDDETIL